jgi:Zn-dependent M28 family amino/carboxypeptidase
VTLRDLGFYLRGRLNRGLSRALNARAARVIPAPVEEVLATAASPPERVRLLEGRTNPERQAAVARALERLGAPVVRHRFATFEGQGENFAVDVGSGDAVLVLVAHHDAVPGSPGANDNAAAVAILLTLLGRLAGRVPPRLRVRLLFTAAEEIGYLGARAYVRDTPLTGVAGVLSLELCGIGDSLALWDAPGETRFSRQIGAALAGLGRRRDETWHQVGRIPVLGSDHRAFAAAGLPAHGLTMVPGTHAEALRQFVFTPWRSALRQVVRRPPPFDTYHTPRDASGTLDAAALETVVSALEAIVAEVG